MAVKGFILVEAVAGKVGSVQKAICDIEGVIGADAVTGPYDIIAIAEAADVNALGKTVTSKIQAVDGVLRTVTCLRVELQ